GVVANHLPTAASRSYRRHIPRALPSPGPPDPTGAVLLPFRRRIRYLLTLRTSLRGGEYHDVQGRGVRQPSRQQAQLASPVKSGIHSGAIAAFPPARQEGN